MPDWRGGDRRTEDRCWGRRGDGGVQRWGWRREARDSVDKAGETEETELTTGGGGIGGRRGPTAGGQGRDEPGWGWGPEARGSVNWVGQKRVGVRRRERGWARQATVRRK